ncbi:MAG: AzlD domain-containing protein [Eubacteriales bacterium]
MPSSANLLAIFIGMFAVTYLPRTLPLTILSRVKLPKVVIDVLEYLPVAILGALLVPSLLLVSGQIDISLDNYLLIAAVLTSIISVLTKKLFVIVLSGIGIMAMLVNFF